MHYNIKINNMIGLQELIIYLITDYNLTAFIGLVGGAAVK
ncbi:hypothetical protein FLAVO9AF_240071 [Flavobacterium sp. 9AF]|nr:hypothetical protein FLAVO9AF_240071 [Flavobacterium sp. 9AF]